MTTDDEMEQVAAIVERLAPGARIERAWALTGGVSARVVAVAFTRADGAQERVVLRKYGAHDWKAGPPAEIAREHALLNRLHALGLPVARPRLLDPSGTLVLDFVEGTTRLPAGAGAAMATALARIHATAPASLPALPRCDDPVPELLAWLPSLGGLAEVLRTHGAFAGPATLLHGDFWPGNLLWQGEAIVAVLDWEDAAVGDPLSDLACARVEIACAAGEAVAQAFTEHYLRKTGRDFARLAVWDLYVATAALRSMDQWGLAPDVLAARRAVTEAAQRRALAALGLE